MHGHFTTTELIAQLKDGHPQGKCQFEEKRADLLEMVRQDIARLICTVSDTNYFSYLIVKRGDLALVIGVRGDLGNRAVTLELIRHRRREAYFSYSDPILRIENLRQRACMKERKGENTLKTYVHEGSLTSLLAMRALLYIKLPSKGKVLTFQPS